MSSAMSSAMPLSWSLAGRPRDVPLDRSLDVLGLISAK